jgi:hypothetical protein
VLDWLHKFPCAIIIEILYFFPHVLSTKDALGAKCTLLVDVMLLGSRRKSQNIILELINNGKNKIKDNMK